MDDVVPFVPPVEDKPVEEVQKALAKPKVSNKNTTTLVKANISSAVLDVTERQVVIEKVENMNQINAIEAVAPSNKTQVKTDKKVKAL